MKRLVQFCAAIGAVLLWGCGDSEPTMASNGPTYDMPPHGIMRGVNSEGQEIDCTPLEPGEERFASFEGYNPDGCSRTERMWHVRPWQDDAHDSEYAELEQPITVHGGTDAAVRISVNGSQQITGFGGNCPQDPTWTTARPLIANCLIPDQPSAIDWAVCPGCYSTGNLNYMRARMTEAWDVWRHRGAVADCNGTVRNTSIRATNSSQERSFATANENYDNAKIVVYPVNGISAAFPGARMGVDKDYLIPRTPIRNGIRYWSWQNAALEVDHGVIESVKLNDCVSASDPNRASKLASAYTFILAHELGHAWGMPHLGSGIMQRGSLQLCSEVFAVDPAVARNKPSGYERIVFANLRDSSGFALSPDTQDCATSSLFNDRPDDLAVVSF